MQRWWPYALPPLGIVIGAIVAMAWPTGEAPPCGSHLRREVADLELEEPCVTVEGQAHYEVVVRQRTPGNLLRAEQVHYLFPLFPPHETEDRAIRVLVRTSRPPEDLVSYESMVVSGRLLPVTAEQVPPGTEIQIGKRSGYFFTDRVLLLVPDEIESEGEVWRRAPSR